MDDDTVLARTIRSAMFFVLVLFIVGGPVYRQVLGGNNKLFRQWTMFSGIGLNVIELRFERLRNGQWEDFDYIDELKDSFGVRRNRALRLKGEEGLQSAERNMCRRFPEETIRVFARRGSRSRGWVEHRYADVLACDEILR